MNPLDRLKAAIDILKATREGLTNQVISKELPYDAPNYVSDILGGSKPINKFFLRKLEIKYSIREEWVMKGEGEMFLNEKEHNSAVTEPPTRYERKPAAWIGVPIFDIPLALAINNRQSTPVGYVTIPRFKDCALGIRISGDDMHPEICNGDYILCKEVNVSEIIMGDDYLVLTREGNEILRHIHPHKTRDSYISLISRNKSKPSTPLALSAIRKIYKVKGVIKSY